MAFYEVATNICQGLPAGVAVHTHAHRPRDVVRPPCRSIVGEAKTASTEAAAAAAHDAHVALQHRQQRPRGTHLLLGPGR
jgi:hypothetical protein